MQKKKKKARLEFDSKQEAKLLQDLADYASKPIHRHFCYIALQDFYYKFRGLDTSHLNKCIEYCWIDINSLGEMQKSHIDQEISRIKELAPYHDKDYLQRESQRIIDEGFRGNIPAFSRLAVIFEKLKDYQQAVAVCDLAVSYGYGHEVMAERKGKLLIKIEKSKN